MTHEQWRPAAFANKNILLEKRSELERFNDNPHFFKYCFYFLFFFFFLKKFGFIVLHEWASGLHFAKSQFGLFGQQASTLYVVLRCINLDDHQVSLFQPNDIYRHFDQYCVSRVQRNPAAFSTSLLYLVVGLTMRLFPVLGRRSRTMTVKHFLLKSSSLSKQLFQYS